MEKLDSPPRRIFERVLKLPSFLPAEQLRKQLKKWEPWSIKVDFSNGVSTQEFERRIPFNETPLAKVSAVASVIPFAQMAGRGVLDLGCNAGHSAIHLAKKYGISCTGVDNNPRNIEVARYLAELAQVEVEFVTESAETYRRTRQFHAVLHFGTLYHLRNPMLSLETSYHNLRRGGYLALETQVYDDPENPNVCYFMYLQNDDPTNFWALSPSVLIKILELTGFVDIRELRRVVPPRGMAANMARLLIVARKSK
jgi:tRNA (mo5U34)-methyltransferase